MGKQLVFIDDSGDPGRVPGVSSERLVMACAVFIDPKEAGKLNDEISSFRERLGWNDNHEFKFRKTSKEYRISFLRMASQYHFDIYAVYIEKMRLSGAPQTASNERLYNRATKELLKIMPLDNAYVKIDGRADKQYRLKIAADIRKEINAKTYKIKEFRTGDSAKDNLIQLADMIVGSINRSFQIEKTDAGVYIGIIRNKIVELKQLSPESKTAS